jgi:hypothetical protein
VPNRAGEFVDLAGATIRTSSRGVSSIVLILVIVQIGPSIIVILAVIWSWIGNGDEDRFAFYDLYGAICASRRRMSPFWG